MSDKDRIPTNLRTLLLLEAMGRMNGRITPAELAREVGLAKQTAHRLCMTLLDEGFLVRDDTKNSLRPGRRIRLLASGVLNASSSHIARHQVLMKLSASVRETVNFVVPEVRGMTYRDRVETDWPFRIQLPVGTHVPFHCTASGKTYLASLPKAERRRLVHVMHLERKTPNTIVEPNDLMEELNRIAKDGYALDREEFIEGMIAIAVPILDGAGRYVASVAFHAPVQRMSIDQAMEQRQEMLDAARRLSVVMFDDLNAA